MARFTVDLLPNTTLQKNIGFRAKSIIVDNYTAYWLYIPDANRYIQPFWVGYAAPLNHATDYGYVLVQSPLGPQNPTYTSNVVHIEFLDYEIAPSPGADVSNQYIPIPDNIQTGMQPVALMVHGGNNDWDRVSEVPANDGAGRPGVLFSNIALLNLEPGPQFEEYDRSRSAWTDGLSHRGLLATIPMVWNGLTFDRWTGAVTLGGTVAVTQSTVPWVVDVTDDITRLLGEVVINTTVAVVQASTPWNVQLDELPAAAALSDALANPTTTLVGAALLGYDTIAGDWDRLKSVGDDAPTGAGAFGRLAVRGSTYFWDPSSATWVRAFADEDGMLYVSPKPANLSVIVTGGANAIATVTIPAVAGHFHYITHIFIKRVATALLAGGALLTVTTTNLGGRAWRTGNQASITVAPSDPFLLLNEEFDHPIKSAVVNTATTIVAPAAGAAVSWQMVVDYFTAPASP